MDPCPRKHLTLDELVPCENRPNGQCVQVCCPCRISKVQDQPVIGVEPVRVGLRVL